MFSLQKAWSLSNSWSLTGGIHMLSHGGIAWVPVLLVEHGLHGYCLFIILPSPSLRLSLPCFLLPPAAPPQRHSLRSEPVAAQMACLHPTSRRPSSSHLVAAKTRVAPDFASPENVVLNMHRSRGRHFGPLVPQVYFTLPPKSGPHWCSKSSSFAQTIPCPTTRRDRRSNTKGRASLFEIQPERWYS